jgi:hypothetical protein
MMMKEKRAARAGLPASVQSGPAPAAAPVFFAPRGAASGFLELKMRLLNFLSRQLTSLKRQSQPFQQGVKPN